jgi:hypothetical protein
VVPIDDQNTLLVYQHCTRFYAEAPFKQARIPYWTGSILNPETGYFLSTPPRNQDVLVWAGQGRVADRTHEHLAASDVGVVLFRKELMHQLEIVDKGGEPKAVIRDSEKYFVMLPDSVPSGPERDGLPGALSTPADMRTIGYMAGFPREIAEELERFSAERGEGALRSQILKEAGWKVGGKQFDRNRHFASLNRHGLKQTGLRKTPDGSQ